MRHLSLAAPVLVILLAVMAWAGAGWLCHANWRRAARRRTAGRLEALRFVLITVLAATLLRPEYVETLQRTAAPEIVILADASDSMKTRDVSLTNGVVSRQQWLAQELARRFWQPLQAKAKVSVEPLPRRRRTKTRSTART